MFATTRPGLRPGFGHCFVAVRAKDRGDGEPWVVANRHRFALTLGVVATESGDLAAFYRRHGFVVVETAVRQGPGRGGRRDAFRPLGSLPVWRFSTCVGLSKAVLGLWAPWVWTPHQLYRHLTKESQAWAPSLARPSRPRSSQ